jgi:hypothetical protein
MSDKEKLDDDKLTPSETLRIFAELIELVEGKAVIHFFPNFFRELADEIDNQLEYEITLVTESGEEFAKITGEDAEIITEIGVRKVILEAIHNALNERS